MEENSPRDAATDSFFMTLQHASDRKRQEEELADSKAALEAAYRSIKEVCGAPLMLLDCSLFYSQQQSVW